MNILLLHGAIGSSKQLRALEQKISEHHIVHALNFSGHGGRPLSEDNFSIKLFAEDVLQWMEHNSISIINIFGYSMGGYVALYLARHHPEKIGRIFTLATKFDWSIESATHEVKMLDADKISEKITEFAKMLAQRHSPVDWKIVLQKTSNMMLEMGANKVLTDDDFRNIKSKVMLAVGDQDKMVSVRETELIGNLIPNAQTFILPETKHPIEGVNIEKLSQEINSFLQETA